MPFLPFDGLDPELDNKPFFARGSKEERREYSRRWHERNKEYVRIQSKKQYTKQRNSGYLKAHNLKRYGLTIEEFDEMLAAQDGKCAICRVVIDEKADKREKRPQVDHCHRTGAVRGILCHHCNIGLSHFRDSPESLLSSVSYLASHAGRVGPSVKKKRSAPPKHQEPYWLEPGWRPRPN